MQLLEPADSSNPIPEDGPLLFVKLVHHSNALGVNASMNAQQQIVIFDPKAYKFFDVVRINQALIELFVSASMMFGTDPAAANSARVAHTLTVYAKIVRPEIWKKWVNDIRLSCQTSIPSCEDLHAEAIRRSSDMKINGVWDQASTEEVDPNDAAWVANFSKKVANRVRAELGSDGSKSKDTGSGGKRYKDSDEKPKASGDPTKKNSNKPTPPPFFNDTKKQDGEVFQPSDTKEYKGTTYHFCECPNHRNNVHWHTWPTIECNTRKNWIKCKESKNDSSNPGQDCSQAFIAAPEDKSLEERLDSLPRIFVANTDSSGALLNTGANKVIISDRSKFVTYKKERRPIKGIRPNLEYAIGSGKVLYPLLLPPCIIS